MTTTGIIALLLVAVLAFAALSRRAEMSLVTMPIIFTAAGGLTYFSGATLFARASEFEILHLLAEVTLVLVLFSDASRVRLADLRMSAGIPARLLLIAMPLTFVLGSLVARWVSPDQPWATAFLLAAILTPTDAALAQVVVTDETIPEELREGIGVESGLNDGLALPAVIIAALAAVEASGGMADGPGNLFAFGLAQITLGPVAGIAVGAGAALILDFAVRRNYAIETYQGIYFLVAAFLCFTVAELIGGNGLIAAFVGGLAFGNVRKCSSDFVSEFMEGEGQLLTMATFLVFGAVLAPLGFAHATWPTVILALAFLTVVRIVPVVLSLAGTGLQWKQKFFLGWFGPRGLASILFGLLVMDVYQVPGFDEVLACMVMTVTFSIVLHGISAVPFAKALGGRADEKPAD